MGKHSGPGAPRRSRRGLARYAVGALLTVLAWAVLVYYAIQLGPDAKAGHPQAWALMAVATLGAVACLFLAMVLASRVYGLIRGEPRPAGAPGGRHGRR